MLDEFVGHLNAAEALVAEIGLRFRLGDPAGELLDRLGACVAEIGRLAARFSPTPPEELRAAIARLLAVLHTAAGGGDDWLAESTGPGLATGELGRRLRQTYGLPARPAT